MFPVFSGFTQILDDSTKLLYSVKTVRQRTEEAMVLNKGAEIGDTSLNNFSEKGDFIYQGKKIYQNLGVFGTASRPLFYQLPDAIGLRNGMNMFDYLIPEQNQIRYFNTRSPYTDIQYAQGAKQRAMIRTTFSVNLKPRLNFTAHYQRLTALRVLNISQSDERTSDHHSIWVSSNYSTKDNRYRAWGYYQHLNHLQYETGGGFTRKTSDGSLSQNQSDSLFLSPEIMPVYLNANTRNRELRNNWYFTQIWKPFGNGLYIRTSHSRNRQVNRYTDPLPNAAFYLNREYFQKSDDPKALPDTLFSDRSFQAFENTLFAGFQDSLQNLSFSIKRRDLKYYSNFQTFDYPKAEWVAGFQFQGLYKGLQARLSAEFMTIDQFDLKASTNLWGWNVAGRLVSFLPSMIQRQFFSKNLIYLTDFKPSRAVQLKAEKTFTIRKWSISPSFEHLTVSNGIAFSDSMLPVQRDKVATMQYAGLAISGAIGKRLHTENTFIRVFQAGSRIAQMPGYVYHSAHYYDLVRNKKAYGVQLGVNVDWRYDWPSETFNPLNGQWFLQNKTTIPPYFLVNAFTNVRIDRVRLYFKVHNVFQKLGSPGYFATPFYPGQRRLFEFGLNWTFFD